MDRILAQYFATAESAAEYADFGVWVAANSLPPPRRRNDGATQYTHELDNGYVKVRSGKVVRQMPPSHA